jgi:alkylated DNA repair dioxygenase AlkB
MHACAVGLDDGNGALLASMTDRLIGAGLAAGNVRHGGWTASRRAVEAAIAGLHTDVSQHRPRAIEAFNTVLVNRYLSGEDSIKWHCDDERFYYVEPSSGNGDIVIASVSLGAERWFSLRTHPQRVKDKEKRRTMRIKLRSGSLLVMAGATQRNWQHCLPKDETIGQVTRINLTFRRVVPPLQP